MSEEIKDCSDVFQDAITSGGTIRGICELCGREHFEDSGDFDEGELEGLIAKSIKEPDKYIMHDGTSVSLGHLNGKQVVYGCPCGWKKLRAYEDFLWSHRELIANYFRKRTARALAEATRDHAQVGNLPT